MALCQGDYIVYSGRIGDPYAHDLGFRRWRVCKSEAAAVMYAFNKWPSLTVTSVHQHGEHDGYKLDRTVVMIFEDWYEKEPCGAILRTGPSRFRPNWDLWKPYILLRRHGLHNYCADFG